MMEAEKPLEEASRSKPEELETPRTKKCRYVVSLQNAKDPSCYNDLYEVKTYEDAKTRAEAESGKTGRKTIIFDRHVGLITYRFPEPEKPKGKKHGLS